MRRAATGRAGYTVLELVVALAIFATVGYTVMTAMVMAHGTHRAVMTAVEENRAWRESLDLAEEMKSANRDSIEVTVLPDGNDQLEFTMPIEVDGDPAWGVFDTRLSSDPEEWSREGWVVRYTIVVEALGGGEFDRQLWRQVVDDEDVVQLQDEIASGLRSGGIEPRGFGVTEAGDMWAVTLTFEGETDNAAAKTQTFHVGTRN